VNDDRVRRGPSPAMAATRSRSLVSAPPRGRSHQPPRRLLRARMTSRRSRYAPLRARRRMPAPSAGRGRREQRHARCSKPGLARARGSRRAEAGRSMPPSRHGATRRRCSWLASAQHGEPDTPAHVGREPLDKEDDDPHIHCETGRPTAPPRCPTAGTRGTRRHQQHEKNQNGSG
jgi:hypothetical protein